MPIFRAGRLKYNQGWILYSPVKDKSRGYLDLYGRAWLEHFGIAELSTSAKTTFLANVGFRRRRKFLNSKVDLRGLNVLRFLRFALETEAYSDKALILDLLSNSLYLANIQLFSSFPGPGSHIARTQYEEKTVQKYYS